MRNFVVNSDGTYNFDFGLYHYQNIPQDLFDYFVRWQESVSIELYRHLFFEDPKTLLQKALKVRW